jgi:NAD(P)-dependent dehydrogenase (short-subunit alcohol dehydrogenase family)
LFDVRSNMVFKIPFDRSSIASFFFPNILPSVTFAAMNTNRVALVTGAATGIGRAIVARLAQDGLDVAFCDLATRMTDLDALSRDLKSQHLAQRFVAYSCDVSSKEQVERMFESVVRDLGGLDVASHCSLLPRS